MLRKPKKTTRTTRTTKTPTPKRLKTWQVVTLVLFIAILGLILYKAYDTYQINKQAKADKILLDRVDQKMRIVYDKIVADVGEPAYKTTDKACTYPSLKFEKGKPSCGPAFQVVYGANNLQEGELIVEKIRTSINKGDITRIRPLYKSHGAADSNYIYAFTDPGNILGVSCSVNVHTLNRLGSGYETMADNDIVLKFNFECTKLEKTPIYRVIED